MPKIRRILPVSAPGAARRCGTVERPCGGFILIPPAVFLLRWPVSCSSAGCRRRGLHSRREPARSAREEPSWRRRSRAAALDLYALGTRLDQTRAELARIDAQLAALREEQAAARQEYRAALVTQTRAQQQLGAQLRLLYEEDEPDPIAVILGSATLNDVIEGLDTIKRIAHATESVLDQAKHARTRVAKQRRHLAAKVASTAKARASAAQSAQNLLAAEAERQAYIAQLRTEQQLNAQQIAAVEQRAAEAQQRAQLVTAQAAAAAPPATATTPVDTVRARHCAGCAVPAGGDDHVRVGDDGLAGRAASAGGRVGLAELEQLDLLSPGAAPCRRIAERLRDGLLPEGNDGHGPTGRARDRRRRPDGDPARHADEHPGLRRRCRRGHGRRDHGEPDRPLVRVVQ